MLGLPYPGGPAIEAAARGGNPRAYAFPRAFIRDPDRLDFSFSGLKTAVRYAICPPGSAGPVGPLAPQMLADLAASFQAAVVDSLVAKALVALERTGASRLCIGGGVAANMALRERLATECQRRGIELHVPPVNLCTDNAVMGAIAVERLKAGLTESLGLDAYPAVSGCGTPPERGT